MTIYAKIGSIRSRGSSDSRQVPTLPTCMVGDGGGVLKSPVDSGYFSCFRRDDKSDSLIAAFSVVFKKDDESDYWEDLL